MREINYDNYPNQAMVPSLKRYFENGEIPGGFLKAVITNNLSGACSAADCTNKNLLFETVRWFYNEVPSAAWGSELQMAHWVLSRIRPT